MLILPLRTPHCAVILTLSTAKGKDLHVFFPSPPVSDRVVPIAPCMTDREPAEMKLGNAPRPLAVAQDLASEGHKPAFLPATRLEFRNSDKKPHNHGRFLSVGDRVARLSFLRG